MIRDMPLCSLHKLRFIIHAALFTYLIVTFSFWCTIFCTMWDFFSGSLFLGGQGMNFLPTLQIWCFCSSLYLTRTWRWSFFIEAWKVQNVFRRKRGSSGVFLCIDYFAFLLTSVLVPWHAWGSPVWMPSCPISPMADKKASPSEGNSLCYGF